MINAWLEPDYQETPADYGWVHETELPNLDACSEWLQDIMAAIYKTGDLNQLEFAIEELCDELGVKYTLGDLKFREMQYHLGYQRALIDMNNTRKENQND